MTLAVDARIAARCGGIAGGDIVITRTTGSPGRGDAPLPVDSSAGASGRWMPERGRVVFSPRRGSRAYTATSPITAVHPPGHRGPDAGVRRGVRHTRRESSLARAGAGFVDGPQRGRCLLGIFDPEEPAGQSSSPRWASTGRCAGRLHGGVRRRVHRSCAAQSATPSIRRSKLLSTGKCRLDGQRRSIAKLAARRRRRYARRRCHRALAIAFTARFAAEEGVRSSMQTRWSRPSRNASVC